MHRRSQAEAFRAIEMNGLLSRLQFLVYKAIFENQGTTGVTSGEIDRLLSGQFGKFTRSASPRLNELVKMGVLEELPERPCRETKQTVLAYRTTTALPDKAALKARVSLSKKDKKRARLALARLWPTVPSDDQAIIKKLGTWLKQQST